MAQARRHRFIIGSILLLFTLPALAAYTVTTDLDEDVDGDGACSLREAIQAVNAGTSYHDCTATSAGDAAIAFAIVPNAGESHTIALTSALPNITRMVLIDGSTQSGSTCAPVPNLRVQITNPNHLGSDGLLLDAGSDFSSVRGIAVGGFTASERAGIRVMSNDVEIGCVVAGTNADGTQARPNYYGLYVNGQAATVGVASAKEWLPNLFSGNAIANVMVDFGGSESVVSGNYIGVDGSGITALPSSFGLYVLGATDVRIGVIDASVPADRQRNVIAIAGTAGATSVNLQLDNAFNNTVAGNYIGLGADGSSVVPLGTGIGVSVFQSSNALIGCDGITTAECGNVIVNPSGFAAQNFEGSYHSAFVGNSIGVSAAHVPLGGNAEAVGIELAGADALVARNIITTGAGKGVRLSPRANNSTAAFINGVTAGSGGAMLDSSGNCVSGNGGGGVSVDSGGDPAPTVTQFSDNWWGATDGPAPYGGGDSAAANIVVTPFMTSPPSYCGGAGDLFAASFEVSG